MANFDDEIRRSLEADADAKVAAAKDETKFYKKRLKVTEAERDALQKQIDTFVRSESVTVEINPWATPKGSRKKHRATAMLHLSDLHLDEVVDFDEVQGLNLYNRKIAEQRLKKVVDGTVAMTRDILSSYDWDGAVLLLGGDLVSGGIHDELRETNDSVSVIDTVDYWADPLTQAASMLLEEFGHLQIVSVPGNHGRNTRKPRAKGRSRDSFDWLLSRMVARQFDSSTDVVSNIPDSADAYFNVYGKRYLASHGDQARGGSGISGLLTPLSLLDHRKRKRDAAAFGETYEDLFIGHWHQWLQMGTVHVNGSLKGIDEYAFQGNFGFEQPIQGFTVFTPEHGVTMQLPIYAQDRDKEGW